MQARVYRTMAVLCRLVARFPIGTNLGLLYLLWMMVSGRLLGTRGAVIPGLSGLGLPDAVVRRAWASLGSGAWASEGLIAGLGGLVAEEGRWRAQRHGGYRPVAADLTGFFRPRLVGCPTKHYSGAAGKALPAIPVGVVARVGSVGGQRWGLPLALVRADPADPSPAAHEALLVRRAVALLGPEDLLVVDRGFGVRLLQAERVPAFVARARKNFVARRATVPDYAGKGRPRERGDWVRPLARTYAGEETPATPPDAVATWAEDGVELRGETWLDLVLPDAAPGGPTFRAVAIHDPRHAGPLLLVTPQPLSARDAGDLYHDRWPVEQVPLAGKQMVGATRQFVSEPETCQRLPELALVAGSVLTYLAATQPPIPAGFWDRNPKPTPGRLRRALAACTFPGDYPLPERIRPKLTVTAHLRTGFFGQRRKRTLPPPNLPQRHPPKHPNNPPVSEN